MYYNAYCYYNNALDEQNKTLGTDDGRARGKSARHTAREITPAAGRGAQAFRRAPIGAASPKVRCRGWGRGKLRSTLPTNQYIVITAILRTY